jgi:hypothetical protein
MYSTSEALTNAIINGEPINKELRLLDSDGVVIKTIKSLKLYSGSNSTSRIQIGSTNSSYIEASIEYDKVLANREMALYCGIDSEMIPMGIYKIMQEPSEDDGIISFKAYDRMRLLDKLYEPTVVIPNGFKNVVNDIAKQCGVTVNFSYTGGTVRNYIKGYTCREMIGYIASMLGMFAYFDRQGVLNFGWYNFGKPVEKTLSSFWSLKKNSSDYKVTGVEFITNSDTKWLAGSEPNIIYCSNPLADLKDAENVYYGPMKDLTYRPAEISMLDDIRLDVTDAVKVTLLDGITIKVPCMTLNQDFTASETKVKAVGNAEGEASNYSGPLTTAMDRLTTDLLLTNRVVATKVDADWVRANTVTADKITAIQAEIDEINANNITTDNLSANVAKLGYLTADSAVIKGKLDTSELSTEVAKLGYLTADSAVIKGKLDTNQLSAEVAKLGYLTADSAVIKGKLDTSELSSEVAKLGYLSASEADIKYANIKLSNIETANVATLLAKVGLIDRATVVEGHITGYLDSVEVNANKITAGTLVADRILLKGSESGLLYALNNLGELTSTTVDSLDGYVLTDRTINADKIVANSITAKELDVANIFANNAVISTITSQQAFINAISTNSVVVGASNTANAAKETADGIKENIYSPNTTTIDGGKITTNSIKAKQIDVTNLFAQDITASGTITGAKLFGTYLESTSGKIADFNITENGFSRELDWVDQWSSSAVTITGSYKAWCEITPNGSGQINIGAGVGTFSYHCPTIRCGYYDRSQDGKTVTKITSFETDMMGISTNYFKADKIISDLIPIQTNDAESTPSGYRETFPSLGSSQQTWQNLYVKSIYVKAGIGDVGDETTGNIEASGKITAQGDIIAGLGTSNQTSLFDKANKKWRLIGNATQDNKIHIPQSVYDIAYEYYIVVKTSHGATFPFYVSYSDVKKDLISGYYLSASYCATARLMATSRTDKDGFDISLNMAWTKELYNGQASTFEIYIYYR